LSCSKSGAVCGEPGRRARAGANALALELANLPRAEPVISTTSEAAKDVIVGVGCRKGVAAAKLVAAMPRRARAAGVELSAVRLIASADIKAGSRD